MVTMGGHEGYNTQATAVIAAVTTFLILFTIFGNVLVIIAVLTSRSLRAPQNLFLVSLAAADILVATLIIPFSLANELMGYWYFDKIWCKAYLALDVLFCTASIVHLCAISLDRYWSVSRALEYNAKRTPRRIKATILVVWLIAALISLPPLVVNENPKNRREDDAKTCELNEQPWYILSSSTCSFFAPCLIMILVYLRIYFIAKHRSRKGAKTKRPKAKAAEEEASQIMAGPSRETSPKTDALKDRGEGEPNGHQVPIQEGKDPVPEAHILPPASQEEKATEMGTTSSGLSRSLPEEMLAPGSSRPDCSPCSSVRQSNGPPRGSPKGLDTLATARGEVQLVRRAKTLSASPWKRKTHLNREKRFTFVLAVVIGVFVLCWFPFFFLYSLRAVCSPERCPIPESTFKFFFWIGYCNSSLNPVIYTIFNQDFRKAFRKILCRQWTQTAW